MKGQIASRGRWIDDVWAGIGNYVQLETTTGISRVGRLSGVRVRVVVVNGAEQSIPTELELNGDPTDTLPLSEIAKLQLGKK